MPASILVRISSPFYASFLALLCFIGSLAPRSWWPLTWLGWYFLLSLVLAPALSWRKYLFLLFLVSSSLFLSTGWKIWSYDERVCVLSILSAVLSFSVTLVIFRWLSIHAKKIEWTVPCAWILLHTASEYLPLATITLDPLFDAPLFAPRDAPSFACAVRSFGSWHPFKNLECWGTTSLEKKFYFKSG